jgi:hypothetical protein
MNLLCTRKHFSGNYLFLFLFFHSLVFFSTNTKSPAQPSPDPQAWMKQQPVEFLENKGQLRDMNGNPAPYLLFKAEAPGLDLYITEKGLSYVFYKIDEDEDKEEHEHLAMGALGREKEMEKEKKREVEFERIDMELSGAHISKANIVMEDTSIAYYNYLSSLGSVYHVKKYRRITIKEVYPGIDWVLYNSTGTGFKYDFIVHPGANPTQVELLYATKKRLQLDEKGNLLIKSGQESLMENSPYCYLSASGKKVESAFRLVSSVKQSGLYQNRIAFDIGSSYDPAQTLVIDPQLVWATFCGGTAADGSECLKSDSQGNIYATGYCGGFGYPLLNGGGYFQSSSSIAFILKFNDSGVLLWATYFVDAGTISRYLTIDNNDNLYLCGTTNSPGFPPLSNGSFLQPANAGMLDAFITKFNSAGTIIWSTLYGGNKNDEACGIATDQNNNVFVVGITRSTNFPVQNAGTYYEGAITSTVSGFIVKFDNSGNRLWASYLKGVREPALAVDRFNNVYVAGAVFGNVAIPLLNPGGGAYYQPAYGGGTVDACILKFSNSGVLRWGTYYGGSLYEWIYSIVADKAGNIFFSGTTASNNLPVLNSGTYYQPARAGEEDIFFLKFDSTGVRLWATYFGGTRMDFLSNNDDLALDDCDNLYFGCATESRNIPLMASCEGGFFDTGLDTSAFSAPGYPDLYIGRFSNTGVHQWGTYLGGDGVDFRTSLDLNKMGHLFITGEWTNPTVAATYPAMTPAANSYSSPPVAGDDHYFVKFTTSIPAPGSQTFSYTGPYCASNTNAYLPLTGQGFQAGGTYTAGTGLSINPLTGQITPSTSTPGSYTVSYKVVPCQCQGIQGIVAGTSTVMISAAPVLSVSGNYTICSGQTVTFTASGAANYTWTPGPTGPSLTVFAPANPGLLNYTLTGQNPGGCSAVKTVSFQVSRCTAIDELAKQYAGIKIYPNPNKGEFIIDSESDRSLVLVNEAGLLIREIELSASNKRKITIYGLSRGIYFISDKQNSAAKSIKLVVDE